MDSADMLPIGGKRRKTPGVPPPDYDAVFLGSMFVGACEAREAKEQEFRALGIEPSLYKVGSLDYTKPQNRAKAEIPTGTGPLFVDLKDLLEGRETIHRYMRPLLVHDAEMVAKQLRFGRLVYINCRLGQNRSAMFAIAVVVAYKRLFSQESHYTASKALQLLREGRPLLRPDAWVMEGFRLIGYEPKLVRGRERKQTQHLTYT